MRRFDLSTLVIPFVYFIAGATSLAGVATTFFYKDDLHLTIAQVQILGSIAIIPWRFFQIVRSDIHRGSASLGFGPRG